MKKSKLVKAAFFSLFCVSVFAQDVPPDTVAADLTVQDLNAEVSTDKNTIVASSDESVPLMLGGIWANDSRYVVFDTGYLSGSTKHPLTDIVLRTFYQWYNDRAAESHEYSAKINRDRNNVETGVSEEIELHFTPLTYELFTSDYNMPVVQEDGDVLIAENQNSGAWDIEVKYSGHKIGGEDTYHVPVAVIGNKLYLKFAVKEEDSDSVPSGGLLDGITIQSENLYDGYWLDAGNANGILVCPPVTNKELLSYYVTNDCVYHIRYWRTDMEYDAKTQAVFTDGDKTFSVPKHLLSAGVTYTCTLGRRTRIRNITKSSTLPEPYDINNILVQKHTKDANGKDCTYTVRTATILVFGKPYLELVDGTQTMQDIINTNNARRHPAPAPLFPPHGVLDFDWSIVENPPKSYDRRVLDLGK